MKRIFSFIVVLMLIFATVAVITPSLTVSAESSLPTIDVPLDWEGEYDGTANNVTVRRNISIYIDEIAPNGVVYGHAIISPSDKAEKAYGVNGSYYFKGNFSLADLSFSMQGYEWIDYPIGQYNQNFTFAYLEGTIDPAQKKLSGFSENGIWEMAPISYDAYTKQSGFQLGVDNNSFAHTSDSKTFSNAGFQNLSGYPLSDELLESLADDFSAMDMLDIKMKMNGKWEGSCYGIATTIGLLYNNLIDIELLSDSGATNYFDMPAPYQEEQLLDAINYYQITQNFNSVGKYRHMVTVAFNNRKFQGLANMLLTTGEDSLSVCLKKIVNAIEDDRVYLLGYSTAKSGHAVLVVGSGFDPVANEYFLQIYDENSVKSYTNSSLVSCPMGEYSEMRIKSDFSGFTYKNVNETNFVELYLLDWGYVTEEIDSHSDDTVNLTLSLDDTFVVSNEYGQYLYYDGEVFDGDLPIYDISLTSNGTKSLITFETQFSDTFTVTNLGEDIGVEFFSQNGCVSVDGNSIEEAVFNLEADNSEAMLLKGEDYSFEAFVGTNQLLENGEYGLVSVNATTQGDTVISSQNNVVTVRNEEALTDVVLTSYIGNEQHSVFENEVQEISFSAEQGMTLSVKDETALPGDTVQVQIKLENNPGLASLKFNVAYDDMLTLQKVEFSSAFGAYVTAPEPYKNPQTISFISPLTEVNTNGVFATLTFLVSPDAPDQYDADIRLICDDENIFNGDYDSITTVAFNGKVHIVHGYPGDVNGDRTVNNKDAILLFQYVAGMNVEVDRNALDVNGDGKVNNGDAVILFRYVAGWDVEISRNPIMSVCRHERTEQQNGYDATCTKNGLTDGLQCSDCGLVMIPQTVIPAQGHSPLMISPQEPTCTEDGWTESYVCDACALVISQGERIPALGHDLVTEEIPPTCLDWGRKETFCRVCSPWGYEPYVEELPPMDHEYDGSGVCIRCGESSGMCEHMTVIEFVADCPIPDVYAGAEEIPIFPPCAKECVHVLCCDDCMTVIDVFFMQENPDRYHEMDSFGNCIHCGLPEDTFVFRSYGDGTCMIEDVGTWLDNSLVVIPSVSPDGDKVIGIREYAFEGAKASTIFIEEGVEYIYNSAFHNCYGLATVCLPTKIDMDYGAFYDVHNLHSVYYTGSDEAWQALCHGFATDAPFTVYTDAVYLRTDHSIIETTSHTLIFGDQHCIIPTDGSVTKIGDYAFYVCEGLTSIVIPEGVTSIGYQAFTACPDLKTIVLPDSLTSIGAFAFCDCGSLLNVEFPDSITSIGEAAFAHCDRLTSIELPSSLTVITENLFRDCDALTSIVIPDQVTVIDRDAFRDCDRLESVFVGKGLQFMEWSAFSDCKNLKNIVVDPENTVYHSNGNCMIHTEGKLLVLGCVDSIIPSDGSVFYISDCAFRGRTALTSIEIPEGLTTIYDYAFYSCRELTSVVIPKSVTSIGINAFAECYALTDVYYAGTKEEWENIVVDSGNSYLTNATIHFN